MVLSSSDPGGPFGSRDTQRIAAVVQYIGTHFQGWQRQANGRTVQETLEDVLESVVGEHVSVCASGRTDSGVHAAAQVIHFDAPKQVPAYRWASILSHRLPADVTVRASAVAPPGWHARFSASCRRYRYLIYTEARPNLFVHPYSWHYYHMPLDAELMSAALRPLVGAWDLSAFRRSGSSRPHSHLEMQDVLCVRENAFVRIELQASGFLYGMVRLIVGLLIDVGRGALSVESFTEIWKEKQRDRVKYAAPPQGLCLLRVTYPDFPIDYEIWYDSQPLFLLPTFSS